MFASEFSNGLICCFCKKEMGYRVGNSTWPIYMDGKDGNGYRCCDECNSKYVIEARRDKTKIMKIRNKFGIEYEGENLLKDSYGQEFNCEN